MQIFSYFSPEDLVYVSLVCKTWSTYFDTKDIWKKIFVYRYGEVSEDLVKQQQKLRWKRIVNILSFIYTATNCHVISSLGCTIYKFGKGKRERGAIRLLTNSKLGKCVKSSDRTSERICDCSNTQFIEVMG